MRRMAEIPTSVLQTIEENQRTQALKVVREYNYYCELPIRPVKMRIKDIESDKTELKTTIVPATTIYIAPGGFIDKDTLDCRSITYAVTKTNKPFPYGHIYRGSGHVCLGNIFVPSRISKYNPQQPLETLFLHNDRNLNHGDSDLFLDERKMIGIKHVLIRYKIQVTANIIFAISDSNANMIKDDQIWILAAEIYKQKPIMEALNIMSEIYDIIFAVN